MVGIPNAASHQSAGNALHTNFNVDYVICYRFSGTGTDFCGSSATTAANTVTDIQESIANFQNLIRALAEVQLETQVRNGDNLSLLVFVKAGSEQRLSNAVYKSRY